MDGTILDTIEDITDAVNFSLHKNGYPERSVDEVKFFVGNGLLRTLELSVPEGTEKQVIDKMFPEFVEYYKNHSDIHTKPYDGVVKVIHSLRDKGKKIAVVSNKRVEAVQELCDIYFNGCFDVALGDQEGIARKPEPDMVNMVIDKYMVKLDKCVYIGDSDVDLMTAKNTGIDCISVTWGFRSKEFLVSKGALKLIDRPEQLLE